MKEGIYEQVINEELEKNLDNSIYFIDKRKMTSDNAKNLLTDYLKDITKKALDHIEELDSDIDENEYLLKEISICNDILELLREKLSFDEYKDLNISDSAEVLQYAYKKMNNSYFNGNIVRPITSLVEPRLFTNSKSDISLTSELSKEILSCDEVCLLVSFIRMSGINPLLPAIKEFTSTGKKVKIITTTYMQATQLNAVKILANIPNVEIKISYNIEKTRLHAKAYIFKRNNGFSTFYIGSSNLSSAALNYGSEWNVKLTEKKSPDVFKNVEAQFESYWNSDEYKIFKNDAESIQELSKALNKDEKICNDNITFLDIKPYDYQEEILEKLQAERHIYHRNKNLIVAATGVGKTVVAAFDFKNFREENPNCKMLFIAHREEILDKSMQTFRYICHDMNFGELYNGKNKPDNIDNLFVSVDGANKLIDRVSPDYYDYIIVDEFHHAAARTYQRILEYYEPKILLGLTATPERRDGQDITRYFDYNIAAEMRLPEAINKQLLVPFQYYGVTDTVDLSQVKWTSFGYDDSELEHIFVDNEFEAKKRSNLIIKNLLEHVDNVEDIKGLGFCVSIKHAEFMANEFNQAGINSIALSGKSNDETRYNAIKNLESGKIKFIFTVDLYNEGIDIPCVNTELLLRPTDSLTIFLQQLGRGLRLFKNKECLTVLDFIGQSNKKFRFVDKFRSLLGETRNSIQACIENGFPTVPLGCSIVLEKVAADYILSNIKANKTNRQEMLNLIRCFQEDTGKQLTLNNFLNHYKISLEEFYKNDITFYRMCKEAGLLEYNETQNDISVVKRISNLFKIDSPVLLNYINNMFDNKNKDDYLLKNMTYYTFYTDKPSKYGFKNIDEGLGAIINSEVLRMEVKWIIEYLSNKFEIIPEKNDLDFYNPLEVYCTYSRNQICASFDIYNNESAGSVREGVKYIKEKNHDIFFVTLHKEDKDFSESTSYDDYAINEKMFHWQTQNSVADGSEILNRYIKSSGRISLFVRLYKNENGKAAPYIYLGECDYVSHNGNKPVNIIWKLKHKIPAKYINDIHQI